MTAKELIKKLSVMPANATVYLSQDEEGNGYGELYEVEMGENCVVMYPTGHVEFEDIYGELS